MLHCILSHYIISCAFMLCGIMLSHFSCITLYYNRSCYILLWYSSTVYEVKLQGVNLLSSVRSCYVVLCFHV